MGVDNDTAASVITAFEEVLTDVGQTLTVEIQERFGSYRSLGLDVAGAGVEENYRAVLPAIRDGRAFTDAERHQLYQHGVLRARQHVRIDEMIAGWRAGADLAWAFLKARGREAGLSDADLLALFERITEVVDRALAIVAAGHRATDLELNAAAEDRRAAFVRDVLAGALAATELERGARAHGLDPAATYVAFCVLAGDDGAREGLPATLTRLDGDLCGLSVRSPAARFDVAVGVGPARPLSGMSQSLALARRAARTAAALRLTGAFTLDTLALEAGVLAEPDLGELLATRLEQPLKDAGAPQTELFAAIDAFFDAGLHVEDAAAALGIHPNTLRHRLRRFAELTGTDVRDPRGLVEVWWLRMHRRLHDAG